MSNRRKAGSLGALGFLLLCVALGVTPAAATASPPGWDGVWSDQSPDDLPTSPKRMEAALVESGLTIDGSLSDPAWQAATFVADFLQKEPDEGASPSRRTEVAILYDGDALYVGARMYSPSPDEIEAVMTRRDEAGNAERLIVSLDTYLDRRTAYSFGVTAAGVRLDWFHPEDNEFNRDRTYNPVWEAATEMTDDGWTAEMRIPFSQLRFNGGGQQTWGINLNRFIPSNNEDVFWVYVPKDETGWSSRFGDLVGIEGVGASRRIEIMPYAASQAVFTSRDLVDPADPFRDGSELDYRFGFDFTVGLGSSLTLDGTVNPDFGQVEADPAEVNLSSFETFFPERRPFFTVGQQTLDGNGNDFYYSRRIGASPRHDADADFVLAPNVTTILAAAKLTGRLQSGLTIGALAAATDNEWAEVFDVETGDFGRVHVEPATTYGIVRAQQEIGADASTVGLTVTGVSRRLGEDGLVDILPSRAIAGGVDWNRRFNRGEYELLGHVGVSNVSGSEAAILDLQENSVHYFQRPDQDHVRVDSTQTSLTGWSASLRGGKRSGNWRWNGGFWANSPAFEINDAGRQNEADFIDGWSNLSYRETEPGSVFRRWQVGAWNWHRFSFGGVHQASDAGMWSNATFNNFWFGYFDVGMGLAGQSQRLTRGGPLMTRPRWWRVNGGLNGNEANSTVWGIDLGVGGNDQGSWVYRVGLELAMRPNDRLTVVAEPRYSRRLNTRQYLDTFDGGRAITFGERYVFGAIERSEVAAPLRLNYSFTPDVSLEVYAEPFASTGRYSEIGELLAPRTSDLLLYGTENTTLDRNDDGDFLVTDGEDDFTIDNPDFTNLSFRSNLVFRWEWRPGSTLFLVWQQNREDETTRGDPVSAGSLFDAFGTSGDNVFSVKVSYWLPIN